MTISDQWFAPPLLPLLIIRNTQTTTTTSWRNTDDSKKWKLKAESDWTNDWRGLFMDAVMIRGSRPLMLSVAAAYILSDQNSKKNKVFFWAIALLWGHIVRPLPVLWCCWYLTTRQRGTSSFTCSKQTCTNVLEGAPAFRQIVNIVTIFFHVRIKWKAARAQGFPYNTVQGFLSLKGFSEAGMPISNGSFLACSPQ